MNRKTVLYSILASALMISAVHADEVIVEDVSVEVLPIIKAKQSLSEAIGDYVRSDYAKAKQDLSASEAWLKKAALSSNKVVANEAAKLESETANFKHDLSKKSTDATSRIRALLAKSKALATRASDDTSSKYKSEKAKVSHNALLLDAKLHLEYARVKQFLYGTKQDTLDELNKVSSDLKSASIKADAKTKEKIKSLENNIDELKKDVSDKSDDVKAKYESLASKIEAL